MSGKGFGQSELWHAEILRRRDAIKGRWTDDERFKRQHANVSIAYAIGLRYPSVCWSLPVVAEPSEYDIGQASYSDH